MKHYLYLIVLIIFGNLLTNASSQTLLPEDNDIDYRAFEEIRTFKGYSAIFSSDSKCILVVGYDDSVKLWDIKSEEEINTFEGIGSCRCGGLDA